MKKSLRILCAFVFAASASYAVSEAQAKPKLRCIDFACVASCQAAGMGNCLSMCAVGCE